MLYDSPVGSWYAMLMDVQLRLINTLGLLIHSYVLLIYLNQNLEIELEYWTVEPVKTAIQRAMVK